MEQDCIIYALRDPRTDDIRYVGQSVRGLERARDHFRPSAIEKRENPHTSNWLAKLKREDLKPVCEVIETVASPEELDEAEIFWIAKCRDMGYRLTNMNAGGNKPPVRVMSQTERDARSVLMQGHQGYWKGKRFSQEHKSKIARGMDPILVSDQFGRVHTTEEWATQHSLDRSSIYKVLKGQYKHHHGLVFKFVEKTEGNQ